MQSSDDILASFIESLRDVGETTELRSICARHMEELGFQFFSYHLVRVSGLGELLPYAITTYPDAWIERYIAEDYISTDPVLREATKRQLPYAWSDIALPEDLTPKQRQLFAEAGDIGVHNGFTIPIHGRNECGTMNLVPYGKGRDALEAMTRNRHLLHLMAFYYHNHSSAILVEKSISPPRAKNLLTPREREVLLWTAKGKTSGEISDILNLSAKVVEFHLNNAKKKLQVFNKTHAVVKAIVLGLINID